jgi:hypothetical protein
MIPETPDALERSPRARLTTDAHHCVLIALAWLAAIALTNPLGDFPNNDDWVYGAAVKTLLETGRFQIPGWITTNLIAQAYWGSLFALPWGFSFNALRLSTIVLGVVGILFVRALLRLFGATAPIATVGALAVGFNPIYFCLSNTFMTDVPFFAVSMASIYWIILGARRNSLASTLIGLALAVVGLLIRQLEIAILFGFSIMLPLRLGLKPRVVVLAVATTGLGLAIHLFYQRWLVVTGRVGMLISVSPQDFIPDDAVIFVVSVLLNLSLIFAYLGLFFLPFLLSYRRAAVAIALRRPMRAGIFALTLGALVCLYLAHTSVPFIGNVLMPWGLGPLTVRDLFLLPEHAPVVPTAVTWVWRVLTVFGLIAGYVLTQGCVPPLARAVVSIRIRGIGQPQAERVFLGTLAATYLGLILLQAYVPQGNLFDRYLLPLIPLAFASFALTAAREHPKELVSGVASYWPKVAIVGVLGAMAAFSVSATHDYLEWNRVRWRALADLVEVDGVAPSRIDGGYEFNGTFTYTPHYVKVPGKSWWWVKNADYVISGGLLPGYRVVRRYPIARWLPLIDNDIVVLEQSPS